MSLSLTRGKGDYFRLGHGTDVHVRKPQMVEGLRGKKIVHVAVGALHCLAVTETGQVNKPTQSDKVWTAWVVGLQSSFCIAKVTRQLWEWLTDCYGYYCYTT